MEQVCVHAHVSLVSLARLFVRSLTCMLVHSLIHVATHPSTPTCPHIHPLAYPATLSYGLPPAYTTLTHAHPPILTYNTHPPTQTHPHSSTYPYTLLLTHLPTNTHPHTHSHTHTLTTHPLSQEGLYSEGWLLGMFIIKKKWFGLGSRQPCQWPAPYVCVLSLIHI